MTLTETIAIARAVDVATRFYAEATRLGSAADDFVKGQSYGEMKQAIRFARMLGGFEDSVSDAHIQRWARVRLQRAPGSGARR